MFIPLSANPVIRDLTSAMQANAVSQASLAREVMAMAFKRCMGLQAAAERLRLWADTIGSPVDAARIREALAHGLSLEEVFSSDPESLAGNHVDAQLIAQYLAQGGLDVEAKYSCPVLVRSIVDGKSSERLIWMSAAERTRLEQLPLSQSAELPGCPTRSEAGKDGEITIYCCLEAFATLRLAGTSMPELCKRLELELHSASDEQLRAHDMFAQAVSRSEFDLNALQRLLSDLSEKLEQYLSNLCEANETSPLDYQQWQKDMQKRQDERMQERKHAIERLNLQRDTSRASR